ncbi:MAG: serine/threonine-protein kinase [Nannocystaceae bacterium]
MSCIDEDAALGLIQGERVSADVRAHLVTCEACRAFVAGLARVMVPEMDSLGGWGPLDGQLAPGVRLGDYVVESMLGRGGMGVVYAARDTRLGRAVAIKLLRDDAGSRRVARLRREAAAMAKLSHPNVAEVFDFGESDRGPFVVMERIVGETLATWASARRAAAEIIAAYVQAGQGLAAAHRAGLVHRDFKPSNAMVVTEGERRGQRRAHRRQRRQGRRGTRLPRRSARLRGARRRRHRRHASRGAAGLCRAVPACPRLRARRGVRDEQHHR